MNLDLLAWWKLKAAKWPALARMARQFLGAPAFSAGVERVFSAAGKTQVDEGPVPQAFALRLLQHQVGVSRDGGLIA